MVLCRLPHFVWILLVKTVSSQRNAQRVIEVNTCFCVPKFLLARIGNRAKGFASTKVNNHIRIILSMRQWKHKLKL